MTDLPPNVIAFPKPYRRPPPPNPDRMLGWEPDDEFNEGWDEGALPTVDPATIQHHLHIFRYEG